MAERLATLLAREFEEVELGDQRLNERCETLAKEMGRAPDKSIPQACGNWADTQAAYRFFSNENVTREALLKAHQTQTIQRCEKVSEIVAIQDTSFLNYTHHRTTTGLGPIGSEKGLQGLVVHTTLAVNIDGDVLGVLDQDVWVRQGSKPVNESTDERRKRDRESRCWTRSLEKVRSSGLTAPVIHVMDREGDIYDVLASLIQRNEQFVIRAKSNRRLAKRDELLWEAVSNQPVIGKMDISVPTRSGQRKRKARLSIRQDVLTICRPKYLGAGSNLSVGIVQVREEHPPKDCAAVSWTLLTSEPNQTREACERVLSIYKRRWIIEEFHMGLKTGCQVEQRQLETRQRLEVFLGFASVISVMLLRLRNQSRQDQPASTALSDVQLMALRSKIPKLPKTPTLRQALRAVAQMGGFLGRKGDGEPGWRTLWRGMYDLLLIEHGYFLAKNELLSRR